MADSLNYTDPRGMMADRYASQYTPLSGNLDQMTIQLGGNAGAMLGNALFGGQSSAMMEQRAINDAIKEADAAEDPDERLNLFAQALRKRGLEGRAQDVESKLIERQKTYAAIVADKALAAQRNRESDPIQEFAKTGKYTPQSLAAFAKSRNVADLVLTENLTPTEIEKLQIYRDTLTDPVKIAEVNKVIEGVQKGKGTSLSVGAPDIKGILQEVSAKEDAKGREDAWVKAGDAYKMQVPMLAKLDEVTQLLPRTFTGSFANTSLQFGKALSGMGIPIDETKLANTEYLNAVSAQLLQTIARNFPGALAVKEMDQLIKSKPNSQQQVTTIVKILDGLKKEMKSNVIAYEQLAKLPESERYGKNFNLVQADAFRKLTRYESLVKKAQQAKADTSGKTRLTKEEIAEAQSLQQELGEK